MRLRKLGGFVCLCAMTLLTGGRAGAAQTPDSSAITVPFTVSGQVLNASSGAGIPRALVIVGSRRVLTDAQGAFSLPQFADSISAAVRVEKPGFSAALNFQDPPRSAGYDLTQPLKLLLYPDGLITGNVTGPDGESLEHVPVQVLRAQYDPTGQRAFSAANVSTDSRGQFRFRLQPGQYRVQIRYVPRLQGNTQAVLPQEFPSDPVNDGSGFFSLGPGEQKQVDLRPALGRTYNVALKIGGADAQNGLQLIVTSAGGESFSIGAAANGEGEARFALPSGSYRLHALTAARSGETLEGFTKVTVSGHDVSSIPLQMAPVGELTVEIGFDLSSVASQTTSAATSIVSARSLNLQLHPLEDADASGGNDLRPQFGPSGVFSFHVSSGRYRLLGTSSGGWSVESATFGQTNLLTGEIVVGAGSSGGSIRLVATNRSGKVSGTVQPASNDPAGMVPQGWVYLIAGFPSLTPYVKTRITRRGTWTGMLLPGRYVALAVADSLAADLTNPEVAARYSRMGTALEITDGGQTSLDLALVTPNPKEAP